MQPGPGCARLRAGSRSSAWCWPCRRRPGPGPGVCQAGPPFGLLAGLFPPGASSRWRIPMPWRAVVPRPRWPRRLSMIRLARSLPGLLVVSPRPLSLILFTFNLQSHSLQYHFQNLSFLSLVLFVSALQFHSATALQFHPTTALLFGFQRPFLARPQPGSFQGRGCR